MANPIVSSVFACLCMSNRDQYVCTFFFSVGSLKVVSFSHSSPRSLCFLFKLLIIWTLISFCFILWISIFFLIVFFLIKKFHGKCNDDNNERDTETLYKRAIKVKKKKAQSKQNIIYLNTTVVRSLLSFKFLLMMLLLFLFIIILFHFVTRTHIWHSHFGRMFATHFCG